MILVCMLHSIHTAYIHFEIWHKRIKLLFYLRIKSDKTYWSAYYCVWNQCSTQSQAWVYKHAYRTYINKQHSSSFVLELNMVDRDRQTHMLHHCVCLCVITRCQPVHTHSCGATIRASERERAKNDIKSASVEHLKSLIRIQIQSTNNLWKN